MSAPGSRGFSLIEVLIALAIFSIIAAVAFISLSTLATTRAALDAERAKVEALALAVGALDRDLAQALARPVRGIGGQILPALAGAPSAIELSHAGFATLAASGSGLVRRSGYALVRGTLARTRFAMVDRADSSRPPDADLMLDAITRLEFRYLDSSDVWQAQWPPPGGPDARIDALPRAVEYTVDGDGFGRIRRVVALPGAGA